MLQKTWERGSLCVATNNTDRTLKIVSNFISNKALYLLI